MSHARQIGILPLPFATAVHDLSSFEWDRRLEISELEPPAQIAPYAAAIDADVVSEGEEVGTGRLIMLYDPDGNDLWQGEFRCVTFAQAEVTPEMVHDPFLADVGWSWLIDALATHDARYTAESGTITTTASTPFGSKQAETPIAHIEIRASWTPLLTEQHSLTAHVAAWQNLLRQVCGLPPEDVTVIPLQLRSASHR